MTIPSKVKREVLIRAGGKCEACGLDVEQLIQDTIDANAEIARAHFAALWNDTNGPDAWKRNDRVWVYEFAQPEDSQ